MNKSQKSSSTPNASLYILPDLRNELAYQNVNMHPVKSGSKCLQAEQNSGMAEAIQEAIEASFGK